MKKITNYKQFCKGTRGPKSTVNFLNILENKMPGEVPSPENGEH